MEGKEVIIIGAVTLVLAAPILPGKSEAWRRFIQEIQGSRCSEYEESRQRLGITREIVSLKPTPSGEIVIVRLDADDAEQVILKWASSEFPFDRWLKRQVFEIHGLDLTQPLLEVCSELVLAWQAS